MRWIVGVLFVLSLAPRAFAQDFNILRGSESVGLASYTNWSGAYLGGGWGYSNASANFSNSSKAPLTDVLSDLALLGDGNTSPLPTLGTADSTATAYGGFVGYNSQWQNLILGVEGDIVHTNLALSQSSTAFNSFSAGRNTYAVAISETGSVTNLDYAELRGRAGVVLGNFLPYGFVAAAVGTANVNVNANAQGVCVPGSAASCSNFAFSANSGRNSALLYGVAIGAGLDYALTQNVFLRGEFEYLQFAPFEDILVAVSSVRVGAGVKF